MKSFLLSFIFCAFSIYAIAQCTPVSVSSHPQNKTVNAGSTTTFSVTAAGTAPFLYFWYRNGTQLPGATSSSYTTPSLTTSDNGNTYYCIITNCNSMQQAISNTATLTVNSTCTPVSVSSHPQDKTVNAGSTTTFSVTAAGTAPFLYFWYRNGTQIQGATSSSYTTPSLTTSDNGNTYYCIITNCNSMQQAISNTATLTVNSTCTPVSVSSHPQNKTVNAGSTTTFSVTAAGTAPFLYFWYRNGTQIPGATSSSYTIPLLTTSDNGNTYYCIITNCNSMQQAISNTATLTINSTCTPVSVSSHPQDKTVNAGSTTTFSVTAAGTAPFLYFWYRNGTQLPGATSSSYTTPSLTTSDNGNTYYCIITNCNSMQQAISNTATLTINTIPGDYVITISSNPSGGGTTSGGGSYTAGTLINLNASASSGFNFLNWTENGNIVSTTALYPVTVNANRNFVANFSQPNTSGLVHVMITPAAAVSAQAQWNIDGGAFHNSGVTLPNISPGSHIVNFKPVTGWVTPSPQTINVNAGSTTNVSGVYTQSIVIPNVTNITFTNVIENHTQIPRLFTLYSGSATVTNDPVKICADGSTSTYIKVTLSNSGTVNFKILNDQGAVVVNGQTSVNKSRYGQFGNSYSAAANQIEVPYTHPEFMDAPGVFGSYTLQILSGNTVLNTFPIEIYRAPIVFMHGFIGNENTFKELSNILIDNRLYPPLPNSPLIYKANYFISSLFSFSVNRKIVPNAIDDVLKKTRNEKYSAAKVILIGHSMGGILSRLYLQAAYLPYREDILKLVTANTPHCGTQFANKAVTDIKLFQALIKIIYPASSIVITGANSLLLGAVKDLRVNSNSIMNQLNIPVAVQKKVPSVTLSTDQAGDNSFMAKAIRLVLKFSINNNLFNSDVHDLIVPLRSQQSGISLQNTVSGQWHVGAGENNGIMSKLIGLINADPNSNSFTRGGFPTGVLPPPPFRIGETGNFLKVTSTDSVKIITPVAGKAFNPNDNVDLTIYTSKSISQLGLIAVGSSISPIVIDTVNVSNISFQLPDSAKGVITLILLAGDSTGWLTQDTSHILVNTPALPDRIVATPKNYNIPLGVSRSIIVHGYFNGQISATEITNDPAITVVYDSAYLSASDKGTFTGLKLGSTNVVYSYKGKSDTAYLTIYDDPAILTASFSYSANKTCAGNPISFTDNSIGLSTGYNWNFSGGSPATSSTANPTIVYNTPGIYKVTLVTAFKNGIDSFSIDSLIEIVAKPALNISGVTSICNGNSSSLDASSGFVKYLWSTGETTQSISVTNAGNYSVTVTDVNGCSGNSSVNLVVNPVASPAIKIAATPAAPVCAGQNVTVNAGTTNSGSNAEYTWYLNGVAARSGPDSTFMIPAIASDSKVYCVLNTNSVCASPAIVTSAELSIRVNPLIAPSVTISPDKITVCSGQPVTFTATSVNGGNLPSYTWYVNGVSKQAGINRVFSVPFSADAQVHCMVTSTANCVSSPTANSAVVPITVIPIVIPAISISATTSNNICSGKTVTFSSNSSNSGISPTYQWFVNGVPSGTNSSTFTTPSLTTSSDVYCVITSNTVCSQTGTSNKIGIIVIPIPVPGITISQSSCSGSTVTFTSAVTNGGNAPSYLWIVNGTVTGNFSDASYTLNNAKNGDIVSCTLMSNAPCLAQARVTSVPIRIDCILKPVTNIDGVEGLLIVPNPSNGDFIIKLKLNKEKNVSFQLINSTGQNTFTREAGRLNGSQTIYITRRGMPAGIYHLKTIIDTQYFSTKVVVVD